MRVEKKSYGKRILNSFVGLLIGILLFFGSFVVLFINEGRENLSNYARLASAYEADQTYDEKDLVYTVGTLSATTYATDNFLKAGSYIYLERIVEMYAYVEHEHSETKEKIGGSSETIYTYTYTLGWITDPQTTNTFKGDDNEKPDDIPENYNAWINVMPTHNISRGNGISINGVNVASGVELSEAKQFTLTNEHVQNISANEKVSDGMIYRENSGTTTTPGIGDVRITYKAITTADKGILFGRVNNGQFEPFLTKKDNTIFRFFSGVETQTQALSIFKAEYQRELWIFRLIGFLMMFFGLLLIANPVMTLLSVLPIFAKIGRFAYGIVAFLISLVLTGLTILIGIIFNNIYVAIGAVVLLIIIVVLVLKSKKKSLRKKPA